MSLEEIEIPVNQSARKSITPIIPIKSRSCTDVICLVFFIVFLIGWLFISIYAFKEGDLQQGLVSIYSKGSKYGIDLNVQNNLNENVGNLNPLLQVPALLKENVFVMIFGDIQKLYGKILFLLLLSMVGCLMFLFLMRWLAGPVVWLSIVGSIASLGFGTYYSYFRYMELKSKIGVIQLKGSVESLVNVRALLKQILESGAMWFWLLMISGVGFLVILSITALLRKRICTAIVIIKEGSKAVSSIKMAILLPFLLMVFKVLVLIYGIFVALKLESIGLKDFKLVGDLLFYLKVYNVVGLFWVIIFITAFGEMVLGATFATWYWAFNKFEVSSYTVITGMSQTVCFHLGTIAFGSLITTICQITKVLLFILDYIKLPLRNNNIEVFRAMSTSKYFFWLFEEFMKFINKNAYIMCAMHGKNFCVSARSAFNLVLRNYMWALNISSVTNIVFFLSKIVLSVGMGYLAYLYFTFNEFHLGNLELEQTVELLTDRLQLQLIEVPIFLVGIGSYIIASLFFKVYSMAIDTIFICFLEDFKNNDGSAEKPYFMSKELMKILREKNI